MASGTLTLQSSEFMVLNGLPENWESVQVKDACRKIPLTGLKIKQKDYVESGKYPVVDQSQELIGGYFDDESLLVPEEPPYVIFGDHTKVKKFVNFKFIAGADGIKVLKPNPNFSTKFFFYLLHVVKFPDKGYARHFQHVEMAEIPCPPIEEQERIVAKIEELFSELDAGVQSLKHAQAQLKTYRQAVLRSVFESIDSANTLTVKDCCSHIADCLHSTAKFTDAGFYCVDTTCISNSKILFDKIRYVNEQTYEHRISRLKPEAGDILFAREGTVGTTLIVPQGIDLCLGQRMMMFRLNPSVTPKYFTYFFQSPLFKAQYRPLIGGTTSPHLNIRDIKQFEVALCSLDEQQRIVEEIESRLSVCDKLEESIETSLKQSEALRQSILKQAFEGKLV